MPDKDGARQRQIQSGWLYRKFPIESRFQNPDPQGEIALEPPDTTLAQALHARGRNFEGLKALCLLRSGEERLHHIPMHVGEPVVASTVAEGEPLVIHAEEMENGRVEIVNVNFVLHHG